jgi:8-amino-3,8-dideoxy-alpha-D-manno-octulosonate transaminase
MSTSISKLAIDGGTPAVTQPLPPMYPGGMRIGSEEEASVLEVLRAKRLFRYYGPTPGESKVALFEKAFGEHMGVPYSAALSSGTASLMCALAGLGVGPGDEVIVPAYTWIATASAVVAMGAVPIIAEVDESLTLDPADVEKKISRYTRVIATVHMRGGPSRMAELKALAQKHNLKLLEDVAQAAGASYHGQRLGAIGDVGAFSLQFNKIITSGEGGVVITSDRAIYDRVLMYNDVVGGTRNNIPPEEILPGINFRMGELAGAVALVQIQRLDGLLAEMRQNKATLIASMADVARQKGITFRDNPDVQGDAAISLIFFAPTAAQADYTKNALRAEGVGASVLYHPDRSDYHIYRHWAPILNKRTWSERGGPWRWHEREVEYAPDMCPRSLDLLGRAVHIDVSPELSGAQVEEVAEALNKVLSSLSGSAVQSV